MADNNEIVVVIEAPLTLMLTLPDGITAGRWEAAVVFAGNVRKIREQYPSKAFQFLPFSYNTVGKGEDPALDGILAIAD